MWRRLSHVRRPSLFNFESYFVTCSLLNKRKMSKILVQKFNPTTGKLEWELQQEHYDYVQEIARSGFADMLHDEERNLKYNLALKKALQSFKNASKDANVLDIGTGTGLLSIMAAKSNATTVTACETFQPMAHCAQDVISHNGCKDKIKLIPKRSTDIKVGIQEDMKQKANILVTEVFDTELIGEGAISTFNHAHQHLLSDDSIVVPARAKIYVQVIECPLALSWNRAQPIQCQNQTIYPPADVITCPGNGAVHDLQLAQFDLSQVKFLSDPIPIFKFDWNAKHPIPHDENQSVKFSAIASGTAHAVFFWWDLDMDLEGDIILSCAPPWAHPDGDKLPWRDHWMQAVYYLPTDIPIDSKGQQLEIAGYHDEYSLWFGLTPDGPLASPLPRPFCSCSVHTAVSRTRLGQLNDVKRNSIFVRALGKVVKEDTICLTLGDCCLLALMVAKLGARKVFAIERNPHCRRLLEAWIKRNQLEDKVIVLDDGDIDKHQLDKKVNLLVAEPVFESSILPWHNLFFSNWGKSLNRFLADGVTTLPGKAHIYAMAIEMKDLWKIRAPVGKTQGIDLLHFDKLIEDAIDASDEQVEPHQLWEYPSRALSSAVRLMTLDLMEPPVTEKVIIETQIDIPVAGLLNGVALWIDWELDGENTTSGGPIVPTELSHYVQWDVHSKQAVYFLKQPVKLADSSNEQMLNCRVDFVPDTFEFKFHFSAKTVV